MANGLLYVLRKRGAETGKFHIFMTPDHKLRLRKGPKPAKPVKAAKTVPGRTRTTEAFERREVRNE